MHIATGLPQGHNGLIQSYAVSAKRLAATMDPTVRELEGPRPT
jgi:hypothetical protein